VWLREIALSFALCFAACRSRDRDFSAPLTTPRSPAQALPSKTGALADATAGPDSRGFERWPIGSNLAQVEDYSGEWVFVDAFKQSRPWISGSEANWEDRRELDLDDRGWVRSLKPGQIARTLLFWREGLRYPSGKYTVLYEGEGTITYFVNDKVVQSSHGRDVLDVDWRKGGIGLFLTATNPRNPLKNIRVIMPGGACHNDRLRACTADSDCSRSPCVSFESGFRQQVFHPEFLRALRNYSVLRFMDWTRTNDSELTRWSERPLPADARYTVKGIPYELTLELANRLNASVWYSVPHRADDDYLLRLAQLLRREVPKERTAYIEHSNEVWNSMFSQSDYCRARGSDLGLSKDPFEAQLKYHSRRSREVFAIFAKALENGPRLVRVMGSQASNAWVSSTLLEHEGAAADTDALAIAPYFGGYLGEPEHERRAQRLTLDQLMSELEKRALPETLGWVGEQAAVAHRNGVSLIAYEGGQHLVGVGASTDNARLNRLFDAANRDRRIHALYLRLLERWRELGGALFVHYLSCGSYSKWGRWGALETPDQDRARAPKYAALLEFSERNPAWW
jgi:hypothetical protein